MIIGCDIGGVIRNMVNDQPIDNGIETLYKLSINNKIIFISKCKEAYKEKVTLWLKKYKLDHFPIFFCESYDDKAKIAEDNKIDIMIDDKIQVLRNFPTKIKKIWFCSDMKKLAGTKKHQPELFNIFIITISWNEIAKYFELNDEQK